MAAKKTATKKTTGASATKRATAPAAQSKPTATKAAAKKPVKLSDAQQKMLSQIDSKGDAGYVPANKTELRTIEKLREHKLVKRGSKDKESGNYSYMTSATGKKFLAQ